MKDGLLEDILTFFDVSITQFHSNSRRQNIVRARQVYFYILHIKGEGVCSIAKRFNWNHSTITHSIKVITNGIKTNDEINNLITNLLRKSKTNEV